MGILLTIVRPSPTRFAGGELEWLEKRLRQVELPAVAAQNVRELRSAPDSKTVRAQPQRLSRAYIAIGFCYT